MNFKMKFFEFNYRSMDVTPHTIIKTYHENKNDPILLAYLEHMKRLTEDHNRGILITAFMYYSMSLTDAQSVEKFKNTFRSISELVEIKFIEDIMLRYQDNRAILVLSASVLKKHFPEHVKDDHKDHHIIIMGIVGESMFEYTTENYDKLMIEYSHFC